ncbi:MAG: DNA repair protein RadA, partial [Ruminococcus sp.]|nr:DNA repair protein RadA [Ruminococcus sp.]
MPKSRYTYTCNQCGYETSKWHGKCPSCGAWNSFEEELSDSSRPSAASSGNASPDLSDKIMELESIGVDSDVRYDTGVGELNRVLGGGLVKGSLVLLGGE